jgi:outer membrane protein assembly factor BamA
LTYNKDFKWEGIYRYCRYVTDNATLALRGALGQYEHEALAQYEDASFLDSGMDLYVRLWDDLDAGKRFFGLGPDSPFHQQTNYRDDFLQSRVTAGVPLAPESRWRVHLSDTWAADRISNGPIVSLPTFGDLFPGLAPAVRQQTHAVRFILDYDSRDTPVTTSRGVYVQSFAEYSSKNLGSWEDFNRYGLDGRWIEPWEGHPGQTTAMQFKYEELWGNAPFWLLPSLGGKYSLRAYGEGRYVDRGMMTANVEQRITFYKTKIGGVATDFEAGPFAGLGTVFDAPGSLAARYVRPVVGGAVRAVARPQVVVSVDCGVGQEGPATFMDINYSF